MEFKKKENVIAVFCNLSSFVGSKVFGSKIPTDCFCPDRQVDLGGYQFSPKVFEYIRDAVLERMRNEGLDESVSELLQEWEGK